MVAVGPSAIDSNCDRHSSRHIDLPDPVPLLPWPSSNRRYLLSESHKISSCALCQGPSGVLHLSWQRWKQHALFSYPYHPGCRWDVSGSSIEFVVVTITASVVSFSAHVYLDKQYHAEGSRLTRFAWFRRKQQLHFIHHLHTDSNFAVIDFFWDRVLGTYRSPNTNPR
jgi:hypothetical protein